MIEANNYSLLLLNLKRFEEAKAFMRNTIPMARRVLGEGHDLPLTMQSLYATALCDDPGATLDDLRDAVATLEEIRPTARRVLGGAHPTTTGIEEWLGYARAALRARETPPPPGSA